MSATTSSNPWKLTDEVWCELCFLAYEAEVTDAAVVHVLWSTQRPTLQAVWQALHPCPSGADPLVHYLHQWLRTTASRVERVR
jgi:hypothetical protein